MANVKIDSIKLKVGEVTLNLSVEDARALKAALDALLGSPYISYVPYTQPVVTWPNRKDWWKYEPVWCSSDGTAALSVDTKND